MKKGSETVNRDRLRAKVAKEHICCDICGQPLDPLGPFEYWRTHSKREVYVHWKCVKEVLLK